MNAVVVSPHANPNPWDMVYVSGWKVTGVGILVDLSDPDESPYGNEHLWTELTKKQESVLFCDLFENYSTEFVMTCPKTGRLYEGILEDQSLTPARFPNSTGLSKVGVFAITQYVKPVEDWKDHLEKIMLHAIAFWLNTEVNNPNMTEFRVRINRLHETHKLGNLIDASSTTQYIKIHNIIHPSWGDDNTGTLADYVDLEDITQELADLVGYTKTTSTP